MTSVLIVVSAANQWTFKDGSGHPTGYWAEELAEPHQIFAAAGWDITIATPGGVAPTVDRLSLGLVGGLPTKTRAVAEYCANTVRRWPIRRCWPTSIPPTLMWCSTQGAMARWKISRSTQILAGSSQMFWTPVTR